MIHRARLRVAAAAVGFAVVLVGCVGTKPQPTPVAAAAASKPLVYYAGVEGLKVYREPSTSSQVVGTLARYEKVTRTDVQRGYALVESAKSGLKGWVVNARLVWRLPAAPAPAEAQRGQAQPEAPPQGPEPSPEEGQPIAPTAEAPAAAVEAAPEATPVPTGTPPSGTVGPSIFNPY